MDLNRSKRKIVVVLSAILFLMVLMLWQFRPPRGGSAVPHHAVSSHRESYRGGRQLDGKWRGFRVVVSFGFRRLETVPK
jgi:hypothetical protein